MEKLLILNLEDNSFDADLVRERLELEGIDCEIRVVETKEAFQSAIQQGGIDAILADYTLPTFDGLSALAMARTICPEVPFIFVTGTLGEEIAIDALKKGATDYVLKDRLERLPPALERALKEKAERDERQRSELALRAMEEDIRRSEERYRTIIEEIEEGYYETDLAGNMTFVNDSFCRLLRYSKEELVGTNFRGFVDPNEYEYVYKTFNHVFRTGEVIKGYAFRHLRKDGLPVFVEDSISLIKDRDGKIVGFRGISRDITERKKGEELLQQKTRELEEANRQLQEAVDVAKSLTLAAERANEAKSEFLANMSHEIRTPMNGVIGMTGLLLDSKLNEEQRRYTEILRSSGEALLELINSILDFAKIEAKKMELEMLDFDLRTTLEDITEIMAVKAQAKGLELTCLIDPEVPAWLKGDPGRLRQILVNLTGNAVKFTDSGEITLRVGLKEDQRESITLQFKVIDTGIGIPQNRIADLFSPFVQGDGSTTRKYGGTGLGLAIAKQLVELMGGTIGAESREGFGTTFWFTAQFRNRLEEANSKPEVFAELEGIQVLVVDDNKNNRLLLCTLLKAWGCFPVEALDGKGALSKLYQAAEAGDPFQVALLDMALPDINGEALATRIKADPTLKPTLLIMLTSMGQRGETARLRGIGFSGYLSKPVRQSHLRACLSLALGRKEQDPGSQPEDLITRHTIAETLKIKGRILVAEDNSVNQIVALGILEKLGFRAEAVGNGKEALESLRKIPYDAVLMDCQMPEMDGFEASRLIRDPASGVINPYIPIIAMTASAMAGDREKCLEAGMNDYVTKPVIPKVLAGTLALWLVPLAGPIPPESQGNKTTSLRIRNQKEAEEVFNEKMLLGRLMGDRELAYIVLHVFLEDMPKKINRLKEIIGTGNSAMIQGHAHSIKGAAGNVEAQRIVSAAFELEDIGKNQQLDRASEIMLHIEEQFERFKGALRRSGWM